MAYNELYHHGVKGMKWGVRRTPAQLGHKPRRKRMGISTLFRKKKRVVRRIPDQPVQTQPIKRKKTISEMSDDEIKARIARMDLENLYKQKLSQVNPPKESAAKKFVLEILRDSSKTALKNVTTQMMYNGTAWAVNTLSGEQLVNTNNKKKKEEKA